MFFNRPQRTDRRGSAVVELAICLPVVMLLIWGTIEVNSSIFVKQTLTSAAHEGALAGIRVPNTADVKARVEAVLNDRLDVPYTCEVTTASGLPLEQAPAGEVFTVILTANPKSFGDTIQIGEVDARVSAIKE